MESKFQSYYFRTSLKHIRIAQTLGFIIYAAFGYLDAYLAPTVKYEMWLLRYGVMCPIIAGSVIATFWSRFERYHQSIIGFTTFSGALAIVGMVAIAPPPGDTTYYVGSMVVLQYTFACCRLRFVWATSIAWLTILCYEFIAIFIVATNPVILVNNSFFFVGGTIIGMFAGYFIEYHTRQQFAYLRMLDEEKSKIESMNKRLVTERLHRRQKERELAEHRDRLEEMVAERTERLLESNDQLKAEIQQRRAAEIELQAAKESAETANRAKSEFLANMSHEIRTPMTAILGFSENLMSPKLTEEERRTASQTIHRNGKYLLAIINDILDLSKIEAGKMTIEHMACSPCEFVAEASSLIRVNAEAKNIRFDYRYDGKIPSRISTDPTRLRQILINLLANAVKFTVRGSVELVVSLDESRRKPRMQFDIIDTGIGMTPQQVQELFQPFTQGDCSMTRRFGGTGLGLTISQRLAHMLGGAISIVHTAPGSGTTFRLTIATGPLDGVEMVDNPSVRTIIANDRQKAASAERDDLTGVRVLYAEDGPDNQKLVSFLLKKAGVDVTVVENGQLALEAALTARENRRPFDVILMDMQMPVMDGYEATAELRRAGYAGPIIALTAHAMTSDRQRCLDAGCDEFATKPVNRQKLIQLIGEFIDRNKTASGGGEFAEVPDTIEAFLEDLPGQLTGIEQLLADGDNEALDTLAHRLSGSAQQHGLLEIHEAIAQLAGAAQDRNGVRKLAERVRALNTLCVEARQRGQSSSEHSAGRS